MTIASGGTLTPGSVQQGAPGTLTVGSLVLGTGTTSTFELEQAGIVGNGVNDLVAVTHDLTIGGTLNLTNLGGVGVGSYTLFTYGGTLTGMSSDFNVQLHSFGSFTTMISTGVSGEVDLIVSLGNTLQWDGTGVANDGHVSGGSGNWNNSNNNWTATGATNTTWNGGTAVFNAPGGTVTLTSAISAQGLIFGSSGYTLSGTNALTLTGTNPQISVTNANDKTTIAVPIAGSAGLSAEGGGTLVLTSGTNSYTGGTDVGNGTLQIGSGTTAAKLGGGNVTIHHGGTLILANVSGNTLSNNFANGKGDVGTLEFNATGQFRDASRHSHGWFRRPTRTPANWQRHDDPGQFQQYIHRRHHDRRRRSPSRHHDGPRFHWHWGSGDRWATVGRFRSST